MTLKDAVTSVTSVIPRSDGRDVLSFLVEEDPSVIIASLEKAHREQGRKAKRILLINPFISRLFVAVALIFIKQWKFGHFFVVVQLIHRLTQADISCTTTACLFFFTLLDYITPFWISKVGKNWHNKQYVTNYVVTPSTG